MIRNRKISILDSLSHPFKSIVAKRKQKRATFFEHLENYDEERINQRAELLEKLRARYEERKRRGRGEGDGFSVGVGGGDDSSNDSGESGTPEGTTIGKRLGKVSSSSIQEHDVPTLSPDALDAVVEDLKHGKDKFSMTDAMSIITGATVLFSREPNVCRVYSHKDEDGFVIVVGDIHGQLEDLLHLLKLCGMPSEKNIYVFNGDLVDRGGNGCEVVLLILAMKLQHPEFVHVNRGNHEDPHINIFGGFEEECLQKYDHGVFQAFHECFRWFPICTIVNDEAFVCHGGPPMEPDGSLVSVKRLERIQKGPSFFESKSARRLAMKKQKKLMRRMRMLKKINERERDKERGGNTAGTSNEEGEDDDEEDDDEEEDDEELSDDEYDLKVEQEYLICKSMIWSDPHPSDDFVGVEDSTRGAGGLFGANVTHEFLKENKLSCIVRSHQCVASGIETCHDARLFTVFSASNYCGKSGNRGAVLRFKRNDKLPQPKFALTWKNEDCLNVDLRHKVSFRRKKGDKRRALQMAALQASEYIIEYKRELFDHWSSIDIKGKGRITREQWADGLQTVLKLRSQWRKMFPMLVSPDEVVTGGLFSMKPKKTTQSLEAMEKASSSSFKKVYVKFPEFLARYTPRLKSGCREWQEEVLDELRQALINEATNLTSAFEKMDVDGSGSIDSKEFTKAIRNIPSLDVLSNAQILSVFNAFDMDDSGTLDVGEFGTMFADFVGDEGENLSPAAVSSPGSPSARVRNDEVSVLWKDRSSKRRAQIEKMISLSRSFNRVLSLKEKEKKESAATEEELQSIASVKKLSGGDGKGGEGGDVGSKEEEQVKISDVWNDDIEQSISKLFTGYQKELHHVWHTIIAASRDERNEGTHHQSIANAHFVDLMLSLDEVINGDLNVLTESSAKRLAEHMDTNKDGTIDYDEFIRATEPDIEQMNRYLAFEIELFEAQRKASVV